MLPLFILQEINGSLSLRYSATMESLQKNKLSLTMFALLLQGDGSKMNDFDNKTMLFHVRGYSEYNTRAMQVRFINYF